MKIFGIGIDLSALFAVNDERYILRNGEDFASLRTLLSEMPEGVQSDFLQELSDAQEEAIANGGQHLMYVAKQVAEGIMGGEAEGCGLAMLLSILMIQKHQLPMIAVQDEDENEYLLFSDDMHSKEQEAALAKYLRMLTADNLWLRYYKIETNYTPGNG